MTAKQNRRRWLIGGGAGCLILISLCIVGLWLYFIGWDQFISPVAGPPAPIPQPSVAISGENVSRLQPLYKFKLDYPIHQLIWSPDSRSLAIGAGQFVNMMGSKPGAILELMDVVDGKNRELVSLPDHNGPIADVAYSPDGKTIAYTGDHAIKLWDLANDRELQSLSSSRAMGGTLYFSSDGKTLTAVGGTPDIVMWEVASGKELPAGPTKLSGGDYFVALSPDGQTLAARVNNRNLKPPRFELKLFDIGGGKELHTLSGFTSGPFSHGGKIFASFDAPVNASAQGQASIVLTDVAGGQVLRRLDGNVYSYNCIAFSPDDSLVATDTVITGSTGPISTSQMGIWDVNDGKLVTLNSGSRCLAFSPDGRFLATGANDGTVQLWGIKP